MILGVFHVFCVVKGQLGNHKPFSIPANNLLGNCGEVASSSSASVPLPVHTAFHFTNEA